MKLEKSLIIKKITGTLSFLGKVFNKLHIYPISIFLFNFKDKIVLKYLYKYYGEFILSYFSKLSKESFEEKKESNYIWICWLQGEDTAPELVKKCIYSIKKHCSNYEVAVITLYNVERYISIPKYVYDKLEQKCISYTHFSDFVRFALLNKYGGMWIDSTFYLTRDIPKYYFEKSIFSAGKQQEPYDRRGVCISKYRWITSFIGSGYAQNPLFEFVEKILLLYIKNEQHFIDYLLIDYFIYIAYKNSDIIKREIDDIPDNNMEFGWLFHKMNSKFNENEYKKKLGGDTFAFKLSYKKKWKYKNSGNKTYYSYFLSTPCD